MITYRAPYIELNNQRRSKNFPTRKEAQAFLQRIHTELAQGTHVAASVSPTVSEASELWLARCERKGLEAKTMCQYRTHVELHITPFIGNLKLSQLTSAAAINGFVDRLYKEGR